MRNIYILIALLLGSTIAFAQTQTPASHAAHQQAEGKDAPQPLATNDTENGRAKNRRAELAKM